MTLGPRTRRSFDPRIARRIYITTTSLKGPATPILYSTRSDAVRALTKYSLQFIFASDHIKFLFLIFYILKHAAYHFDYYYSSAWCCIIISWLDAEKRCHPLIISRGFPESRAERLFDLLLFYSRSYHWLR